MNDSKDFQVLYDYSDVPTIKKFAMDNTRMRCLMGPFACLSGDTEFLSQEGWVRIDQWDNHLIAQYDPSTDIMTFNNPVNYINQPYNGEMYHFKSRGLDMVLTPNHRVLFNKKYNNKVFRVITAKEVFDEHNKLLSGWDGMIPTAFNYEGKSSIDLSDDELRLMVAICADGHFPKIYSNELKCYIGLRRIRKRERLSYLLTRMGIEFEVRNYPGRPTEFIYVFDAPERNKTLTKYWRSSKYQLGIILDEMIHWDGCEENRCGVRIFSTTQKKDADFMQYVFACHGIRASISLIHQGVGQQDCYNVIENQSRPFVGMRHDTKKTLAEKIYVERQYCFETETGFFVARRNDKIFITGNSGKSSGCVIEDFKRAQEQVPGPDGIRRSRSVVVRNSYTQLRDTTIKTYHDWFPPRIFGEWRVTDHTYIFTKVPGVHHEVIFRALDRPDQVSNLLSLEVTWAWFNEVREIPWSIIEAMDSRIGRYPSKRDGGASWYGMFMDTNPPDEGSTLYNIAEKIKPDNFKMFKQPSGLSAHAENTKHIAKNYYQNLAKGKSEMYIRVYIHGQYGFLISGKPVFGSFVDNVHVAPNILEPIKGRDVIVGFDFGLNPTVVIGQITPLGQLRILDELTGVGGIRQFCENELLPLLRQKYFGMNVMGFGDPAGTSRSPTDESTCFEVLQGPDVGLRNVVPAPTNAIMPRVGAVEFFLNKMYRGEPGLIISPNCHNLRKAMNGGYHYEKEPKTTGEEYKPVPEKNFSSHVADSLEMLCLYIQDKESNDKRWKAFAAQVQQQKYVPSQSITGY
jgi:hypothetical protein